MAKTRINVFLIKEGKSAEDALLGLSKSEDGAVRRVPDIHAIEGIGTLYYLSVKPHDPAWAVNFFGNSVRSEWFTASSSSAVLLVEVKGRLMALTFGYGRNMLNHSAVEARFGLKVVLGLSSEAVFRRVSSTSIAGNSGKTSEQLPRLSGLSDFSIDKMIDTLDKVDAKLDHDPLLGGAVSGGDSLAFSTDDDVHTIVSRLGSILDVYFTEGYKQNYSWIDNVSPVKDKAIIAELKRAALQKILSGDEAIWTAPAELIDFWDNIDGFRIPGIAEPLSDILIDDVVRSFGGKLTKFEQLEGKRVAVLSAQNDGQTLFNWPISRCLYGEVNLDGNHYCVNAGLWYQVSQDFADETNRRYLDAVVYDDLEFPVCEYKGKEGDYNELLVKANPGKCLLMDARNIHHGLSRSKMELCDVLQGDDCFIHVKHYSSSSNLSHLFLQGAHSATLVMNDMEFVNKANQKMDELGYVDHPIVKLGNVKTVVFAIICQRHSAVPNIPFFSRISFVETQKRLSAMKVQCMIRAIHELPKTAAA